MLDSTDFLPGQLKTQPLTFTDLPQTEMQQLQVGGVMGTWEIGGMTCPKHFMGT